MLEGRKAHTHTQRHTFQKKKQILCLKLFRGIFYFYFSSILFNTAFFVSVQLTRCQQNLFFCLLLFKGTFTSVLKDKMSKRSHTIVKNQGCSYFFCLLIEGSGSGSGSRYRSGSGRTKNKGIQIHGKIARKTLILSVL